MRRLDLAGIENQRRRRLRKRERRTARKRARSPLAPPSGRARGLRVPTSGLVALALLPASVGA